MDYFPVFLAIKDKKTSVIGGGEVACRKVDLFRKAGAKISIISPSLHPYLATLAKTGAIDWINSIYTPDLLEGSWLVWATTDNSTLNQQICDDAARRGIWVNVVDDKDKCQFITPSIVDRSPIQVAISSGGASPVLVRYLREKLETTLPQNLGMIANYAGQQRDRIKFTYNSVDERRRFWEHFLRHPQVEAAKDEATLETLFKLLLDSDSISNGAALYLIETNHDPERLSLKALRLMQQSEMVLFPGDADDIFVDLCRRDAERMPYTLDNVAELVETSLDEKYRICILIDKAETASVISAIEETVTLETHVEHVSCQ